MPLIEYRRNVPLDDQYRQLLIKLLKEGEEQKPLNKPGRPSTFCLPTGARMEFDLRDGFPLLGYRYLSPGSWRGIVVELLWFIAGRTDVEFLHERGVHIWDLWIDSASRRRYGRRLGDLGAIYGQQWRHFYGPDGRVVDQLARLVHGLRTDPDSKAHVLTSWHPTELMEQDCTSRTNPVNCHSTVLQFNHCNGWLDLHHTQRSGDGPVGVPFNIASYSLLLMMMAQVTGLRPRYLIHTINNFHYYANQRDFVEKVVKRAPMPYARVYLNPRVQELEDFGEKDIFLKDYLAWPTIKMPVSA